MNAPRRLSRPGTAVRLQPQRLIEWLRVGLLPGTAPQPQPVPVPVNDDRFAR